MQYILKFSLLQLPFYSEFCNTLKLGDNCSKLVGFEAVYKIMFGTACFYFLMMIIMFNVSSSQDCRAKIQNGYDLFSLLFLIMYYLILSYFNLKKNWFPSYHKTMVKYLAIL